MIVMTNRWETRDRDSQLEYALGTGVGSGGEVVTPCFLKNASGPKLLWSWKEKKVFNSSIRPQIRNRILSTNTNDLIYNAWLMFCCINILSQL